MRWATWLALAALALGVACVKRPPVSAVGRQAIPLVSAELTGGPDFTRVTFVWMGAVEADSHLDEVGGVPTVTVDVHPAHLGAEVGGGFTREGRSGAFVRAVDDGAIEAVRVEPGEQADRVRLSFSGAALQRYRVSYFEKPNRLVVDCFADADPSAVEGEADALGTLMEAMSGADAPAERRGPFLVVVDAGHGGFEPGATGARGIREKDVNLAIARHVAARLAEEPGVKAVLTRDSDIFLPLKERTDFANERDADLFVSVHANASPSRSYHGIETYYLNTATDEAAARLARRENTVAGGLAEDAGDDHLMGLLRDLSVEGQVEHSRDLALRVQRDLVDSLAGIYGPETVRDLGVKTALFYVLVGTRMPSILVETAFVSNPLEEIRLSDPFYQEETAAAIVRGILAYAEEAGHLPPGP